VVANARAIAGEKTMKLIAAAVLVVLALIAAGFFFLRDQEFTFRLSESELRERLDDRLPWSERYYLIFEVTVDNPRVDLIEGSDRVAGGVDATLNIFINNNPQPLSGAVDLSGSVKYVREEAAFYLTDPQVENVRIAGVPDRYANKANEAISSALSAFYKSRPIYTLEGTDASHQAARLLLKDVTVKDEHLIVTLALDKSVGESQP
jgi:hypothetical protein